MRVEPKTTQQLREIEESSLLADGTYDFEVIGAVEKQSAKGNDMVELKIRIEEDRPYIIADYLVSIDSMAYKIRHFAESVGLVDEYERGVLPADQMIGCTGKAKIKTQPAKGEYRAKNVVADYVKVEGASAAKKPAMADLDDEIPF
jgi:hypothetical protein